MENWSSEQHNYWCHECDLSVSISTSPFPVCPHCHNDFLEHLNPSQPPPNPNPNPISPFITNPDLNLFIRRLTHPDAPTPTFLPSSSAPASKAFISSLPNIKVFDSMSGETCAICKDQFLVDLEVKQLPCAHIYHAECILPWLSTRNSCPVCRFKLPVDEREEGEVNEDVGVRFWELMESEDGDVYGFGSTLRHIARRHGNIYPGGEMDSGLESLFSPIRMDEAEGAFVGPDNSVETVSSSFHLERGVDSIGLAGDEECNAGLSGFTVSGPSAN